MPTYEIRQMTRPEVDVAVEWAAAEGWNPGLHDADAFFAADPDGFFAGLLDGEIIATISAVAYHDSFGFIGLYIVKPEQRGKGYGLRLWQHAMAYLGSRNIGLDGVLEQQANYERSGFTLAYLNVRYGGTIGAPTAPNAGIVPLTAADLDRVSAYDRPLFPAPRRAFLERWLGLPGSSGFACEHDGNLAGCGVIRTCRSGYKIGPLFADDETTAESLYAALTRSVRAGSTVFLDVPPVNPAAVALAERHNLTPVFETVRMYTQAAPDIDLYRVFGVTTFELG